ncbi:MAG: hypothetical protein PHT07_12970 [Paludibacter sp.]|nr:hypothetical protein [Paludibacter sp.]
MPGIEMSMPGACLNGLADGLGSVGDMVLHPVNTLNDMGNAFLNLGDTYTAFNNLANDYFATIRNGDGKKFAYYTGNFLGVLAGGEMTGGAASRLGQAGKTAFLARMGEAAAAETRGYSSFRAFKAANGSAGEGMAWHHIVEQNLSNIAKFGPEAIHT